MWRVVKLLYVEHIVVELDNGSLVIVNTAIVGSTENSDNQREVRVVPSMHFETFNLGLVGPNNGQKLVILQELGGSLGTIEVRASSDFI